MRLTAGLLVALVAACGRGEEEPRASDPPAAGVSAASRTASGTDRAASSAGREPVKNLTPNDLTAQGTPTIVVGTLGDDAADRAIVAQARLLLELYPRATVVPDTSIDVAAGPSGWPPNAILYGGAHTNAVVAGLGDALPLQVDAQRIAVGGETYAGVGDRVIAVVPAGANHPAFLLYAGTGTPGVVEINSIRHGDDPLLIVDVHGRLQAGTWVRGADGKVTAMLGARAPRIAWRVVERAVAGVTVRVAFPQEMAAAEDEPAVVQAIVRGITLAVERLEVPAPPPITVYVYPDRTMKGRLTGEQGDGHAVASGAALHVIRSDPRPGGGLEHLVTHESTHAITGQLWGPAGSDLLREGVAVWASGMYGGTSIADWQHKLGDRPPVTALLPVMVFRGKPEPETYPFAGLLVTVAVELVGLDNVRDHLFGATAATWADACTAAGTSAQALDGGLAARR